MDSIHRAAVIMTSSGMKLKQPYRLIYPLETSATIDQDSARKEETARTCPEVSHTNTKRYPSRRCTRAAAQAAKEIIRS